MREIKFRFFSHEKNEYLKPDDVLISGDGKAYYFLGLVYHGDYDDVGDTITKEQYTGLKDMSGGADGNGSIEICNSDILHKLDPVSFDPLLVKVVDGYSGFCVEPDFGFPIQLTADYIKSNELVVIGNIHQNPELLEK
jgi:uncharacterized phage protein (TIGR01671 family)